MSSSDEFFDEEDKVCIVCGKWAINEKDFDESFKSCTRCPQSYHKQCIGLIYRSEEFDAQCSKISDRNGQKFKCCARRTPKEFVKINSECYAKSPCYYNHLRKVVDGRSPKESRSKYALHCIKFIKFIHQNIIFRTFKKRKYPSIIYKGIKYSVGDAIELKNTFEAVHFDGAFDTNV